MKTYLASALITGLLFVPLQAVALELDWQAPRIVDRGDAERGPWRMNESEFNYVDDASVSLRDDGELAVVWVDNAAQSVLLQRFDAAAEPRFESPTLVSDSPEIFSWLPLVQLTDDDELYVLWQEIVFSGGSHGGEIYFARSDDGGASFSTPQNLSNTQEGAGKGRLSEERWDNGSLDMLTGRGGDLLVAWTTYEGGLMTRRSVDGGRSFSAPRQVAGDQQQPARGPSLALAPSGRIYLAWAVGEDPAADIHIAYSDDGGDSFSAPQALATPGQADTPAIATDRDGAVHLVYAEQAASEQHFRLRYQRLDQDGSAEGEPNTLAAPQGQQSARAPSIAVDADNRLYVLWEHHPQPGRMPRGLGFAVSADGGQSFSRPQVVPGSVSEAGAINGSLQGQLGEKLAANAGGELAVVNSHFIKGEASQILLIRAKAE